MADGTAVAPRFGSRPGDDESEEEIATSGDKALADMFHRFDSDGRWVCARRPRARALSHARARRSGSIDFDEFMELTRMLNLRLGEEHAMKVRRGGGAAACARRRTLTHTRPPAPQLFAAADKDGSGELGFAEFTVADHMLKAEVASQSLEMLGMSKSTLVQIFLASVVTLLLLVSARGGRVRSPAALTRYRRPLRSWRSCSRACRRSRRAPCLAPWSAACCR